MRKVHQRAVPRGGILQPTISADRERLGSCVMTLCCQRNPASVGDAEEGVFGVKGELR